jgi:peptidoglycan hydrolase-like protein with peptidoglycan-binding domain
MPSRRSGRALPCPQIARRDGRIGAGAVALAAVTGALAAAEPAAGAQPLLSQGSGGSAVARVQRALDVGSTGYFGPVTRAAVIAFQRRDGLLVDGIVGPQTRGALFGASDGSTPSSQPTATDSSTSTDESTPSSQPTASDASTSTLSSGSQDSASSSSGGYVIPASIVQCESGGDYSAVDPTSGAGGAYQILPSTWQAYGGQGLPEDASPAEQGRNRGQDLGGPGALGLDVRRLKPTPDGGRRGRLPSGPGGATGCPVGALVRPRPASEPPLDARPRSPSADRRRTSARSRRA